MEAKMFEFLFRNLFTEDLRKSKYKKIIKPASAFKINLEVREGEIKIIIYTIIIVSSFLILFY